MSTVTFPNQKLIQFHNYLGIPMVARRVEQGDRYGLRMCMLHERADDPMIEFYDARYTKGFTEHGQFISRYYLDTLKDRGPERRHQGLCLDGGVDAWNLGTADFAFVMRAIGY